MASTEEILRDIEASYEKIEQCGRAKEDLRRHIEHELSDIESLKASINVDERRIQDGKKPLWDIESMKSNITRCQSNIDLFELTIAKEDASIAKYKSVIEVLRADMVRPKNMVIDANSIREVLQGGIKWH